MTGTRTGDDTVESLCASLRRNEALVAALARGTGPAGVLEVLRGEHPDLPLAVVSPGGRLLAAAGVTLGQDDVDAVARALARRPPPLELHLDRHGPVSLFLVPEPGAGGPEALVCVRRFADLGSAVREALEQAAGVLGLDAARRRAALAVENRFAGELLDLATAVPPRTDEVRRRLAGFGLGDGPFSVLSVAPTGDRSAAPGAFAERIRDVLARESLPGLVVDEPRDVVVVVGWRQGESQLHRFAERVVAALDRGDPSARAVAGVGSLAPDAALLGHALLQARDARRVLAAEAGESDRARVSTLASLSPLRHLLGQLDREVLSRYASGILGPLREHDRRHATTLEATLRSFLAHGANWGETAQALHVHVNTLRKRLLRVAELTGLCFTSLESLSALLLATMAEDLAGTGDRTRDGSSSKA